MKKVFCNLLLLFALVFPIGVFADSHYDSMIDNVNNGDATLLCEWTGNSTVRLYVKYEIASSLTCTENSLINNECAHYEIFRSSGNAFKRINNQIVGTYAEFFETNNDVFYKNENNIEFMAQKDFHCTPYLVLDTDGRNEVCFGEEITDCSDKKFNGAKLKLNKNNASIYRKIVDEASKVLNNKTISVEDLISNESNSGDIDRLIADKSKEQFKEEYLFDVNYKLPSYIENKFLNIISEYANSDYALAFDNYLTYTKKVIEEKKNNGSIDANIASNIISKLDTYSETLSSIDSSNSSSNSNDKFITDSYDDFSNNCRDFSKALRFAGYIILVIKVVLPIVLIFKASLNLSKVVMSGAQEDLKKTVNKTVKNIVAAIMIFFVPTILNVIFGLVSNFNPTEDSKICRACIFEPFSGVCTDAVNYEPNEE